MSAVPSPKLFEALETYHRQVHEHLALLAALARHIEAEGFDAHARQQAGAIEAFFSGTSRQHHVEEEKNVFRPLLVHAAGELRAAVSKLEQDHGWLEENWIELAPQLRALASGNHWFDAAELRHDMEVFLELYRDHLTLEETQVYPASRALQAEAEPR